jgi:hypothetical protein
MRVTAAAALIVAACASGGTPGARSGAPSPSDSATTSRDSTHLLLPAGYGTLRQDDIAIRLQLLGLQVRAIPLDETIIRLLSPDSYRALRDLVTSQQRNLEATGRRTGLRSFDLWYVSFFGTEQGETRFSPMEFILTSVGRDFRPIEVLPVTSGFGEQRLRQRDTQSAVYVFDPQIDINQPLIVQYESVSSSDWSLVLSRIERERALVRSRAGLKPPSR